MSEQRQSRRVRSAQDRPEFDVFLCYTERNREEVLAVSKRLKRAGVRVWMDTEELRPGSWWREEVARAIPRIGVAAVFMAQRDPSTSQNLEIELFIERRTRIIPVILGSTKASFKLPLILRGMTSVDFRQSTPDPLEQLIWGIMGRKPKRQPVLSPNLRYEDKFWVAPHP